MPLLAIIAAAALQAAPARPAPTPPVAATAPAATEASDGRCLLAFAIIGGNGTPQQQEGAKIAAMYFYGKLIGRNPRIDLTGTMRSSATAVQSQLQAEVTRCAAELQGAGNAMTAAGNALQGK